MEPENQNHSEPLIELAVQGYTEPRKSARVMLDLQPAEATRLLMVGFGIALSCVGVAFNNLGGGGEAVLPDGSPRPAFMEPPFIYVFIALLGWIQYRLFSAGVHFFGSMFGGKADLEKSKTSVAWWSAVTAPLQFIQALMLSFAPSGLGGAFVVVSGIMVMWILASFAAEANEFESAGQTMAVLVGILFAMAIFVSMLLGGPG